MTLNFAKIWALIFITFASSQIIGIPSSVNRLPPPTAQRTKNSDSSGYGAPTQLAILKDKSVKESSGLVASRNSPGVYWTHNDSGDGPFIYAVDTRGGLKSVWRVTGAKAQDWEDMASGPGPVSGKTYLYIGDICDNQEKRREIIVYRVPEPDAKAANGTKRKPLSTEQAEIIRLRYPDGAHNAETLLVHPRTGNLYIVLKVPFGNPGIYEAKAPLRTDRQLTLTQVGTLNVPILFGGLITGGSISPDGRRVAFCDYLQGYEAVLPGSEASFDTIWTRPLSILDLGGRKQGEAIAYRLDGKALLMTSEGSPMPLTQIVRR